MTASRRRLLIVFVLGLVAGLVAETILFVDRQCGKIENALKDDFRVILTLKGDLDEGRQEILSDRLRAIDGVQDVERISANEALEALKRDDPELVDSVGLLGGNPLPVSYEVKLTDEGLGRISQWISQAEALADWSDILYKPEQVQAILQTQFYRRLIELVGDAAVCAMALVALFVLWERAVLEPHPAAHHPHSSAHARHEVPAPRTIESWAASIGSAMGGAALGALIVFLLALPMRGLNPWWAWPSFWSQVLLVGASSTLGLIL